MALPNIQRIGISGMQASRAAVSTTGHNIANANTEGYSRQRVTTAATEPQKSFGKPSFGTGTTISRVERINDEYVEKQIRTGTRDMAHLEEKQMALSQTEDIFNEMNGEGLNRLVARFFNEFRKLSNEPDSESVRQSVREASQSMINDFKRLRGEVEDVRKHIDSRIEGYAREVNATAEEIRDLNLRIRQQEVSGAPANDLEDKRDVALKKLSSYMDLQTHKDGNGNIIVDVKGIGPLVAGPQTETLSVERSPADGMGKPEAAFDLRSTASAAENITHQLKGGRLGALLEVRDGTISTILDRLDDLAYSISTAVNEVHQQGFSRMGLQGVNFFKQPLTKDRASEFISLSDEVKANVNNIATAAIQDAPGDNRIALAIAGLQNQRLMNDGMATLDEHYNSIVSDVGIAASKTKSAINHQRDIMTNLNKMHDQISGVSLDEETANLMQFQHTYDASAKVIQVADEMLKTVLDLKR